MGPAEGQLRQSSAALTHLSAPNGLPPETLTHTPPAAAGSPRRGLRLWFAGIRPVIPIPKGIIGAPAYSEAVLNAASKHGAPGHDDTPGVILLKTKVAAHSAVALFDTGAAGDFISWSFVLAHGLDKQMSPSQRRVKYADGSVKPARGELTLPVRLLTLGEGYDCKLRLIVAELQPRFDIVLGTPFCRAHEPRPDWGRMTIDVKGQRARDGAETWTPVLHAEPLVAQGDGANTLALCELSTAEFGRLLSRGQFDNETVTHINIRQLLQLNALAEGATDTEPAELQRLRDEMYKLYAAVFPDKLPSVDPATVGKAQPGQVLHRIELKDGVNPYTRPLRRMSTQELDELKKQLRTSQSKSRRRRWRPMCLRKSRLYFGSKQFSISRILCFGMGSMGPP